MEKETELEIRKCIRDTFKEDFEQAKYILMAYQIWLDNNEDEVKDMSTMQKIHTYLGL